MCGFSGKIFKNPIENREISDLERLSTELDRKLFHRGPDEGGSIITKNALFHHRRLSIIDLNHGKQPFFDENKKRILVYNGELYNYRELKRGLSIEGESFLTDSDTEVVFRMLCKYGKDAVERFDGMFSFVFYDMEKKKIIAARDKTGEKPLYFSVDENSFIFSSELKALKILKKVKIDPFSIVSYFNYQYIPAPFTAYKDVYMLEPGNLLTIDIDKWIVNREEYFDVMEVEKVNVSFKDAKTRFEELMRESIRTRLISDVPVGAFLSGGIDSSLIVKYIKETGHKELHTFSIGFKEKKYDETPYSDMVSKKYGTIHHSFYFELQDILENIDIISTFDEPFADSSAMPMFFLAKNTSEYLKVALSGDGSDEIFGGYRRYEMFKYAQLAKRLPGFLRRQAYKKVKNRDDFYSNGLRKLLRTTFTKNYYRSIMNNFSSKELNNLFKNTSLSEENREYRHNLFINLTDKYQGNIYEKLTYCDLKTYLPYDILTKVDRMTMANSLESRAPFLDPNIIEFAFSLPWNIRRGKKILKEILADDFGKSFAYRKKKGFGIPLEIWFRGELSELLISRMKEDDNWKSYLNERYVERLIDQHRKGIRSHHYRLWQILAFILWSNKQ